MFRGRKRQRKEPNHLPLQEWWVNRQEIIEKDEEGEVIGEKSRCFTPQELMDMGLVIDLCKFPKEEEEVLPPEELLTDYHGKRVALDKKIDTKLEQIQKMLGIEVKV